MKRRSHGIYRVQPVVPRETRPAVRHGVSRGTP